MTNGCGSAQLRFTFRFATVVEDAGENEMEFAGFLPERVEIVPLFVFSRCEHPQPVFRFPRLFLRVPILLKNSLRETASSASQ